MDTNCSGSPKIQVVNAWIWRDVIQGLDERGEGKWNAATLLCPTQTTKTILIIIQQLEICSAVPRVFQWEACGITPVLQFRLWSLPLFFFLINKEESWPYRATLSDFTLSVAIGNCHLCVRMARLKADSEFDSYLIPCELAWPGQTCWSRKVSSRRFKVVQSLFLCLFL